MNVLKGYPAWPDNAGRSQKFQEGAPGPTGALDDIDARADKGLCQIVTRRQGVRHVDAAIMFVSLWLLTSMVIDVVTPNELSVYLIGAAIAPATVISGVLYWLRVPTLDFAAVFATIWMASEMVLEMLTPAPLSPLMAIIAVAPMLIVGAVINVQHWRRTKRLPMPDSRSATS